MANEYSFGRRVFIVGSCVSRDVWTLADAHEFEIAGYVARTSLASAFADPYDLQCDPTIPSAWQKDMLVIDSNKNLRQRLSGSSFDILLVDLIDERFEVFIRGNSVVTNSFAFRGAGLGNIALKRGYRMLRMDDPERGRLWARGWKRLYDTAVSVNPNCLVVMNEVQWGWHPDMPPEAKPELTRSANALLRNFYRVAQRTSGDRFRSITYDPSLFEPDPNHKWGIGPFHYKADLYHRTVSGLCEIVDGCRLEGTV